MRVESTSPPPLFPHVAAGNVQEDAVARRMPTHLVADCHAPEPVGVLSRALSWTHEFLFGFRRRGYRLFLCEIATRADYDSI